MLCESDGQASLTALQRGKPQEKEGLMQPVGDVADVKGSASRGLSVVTNALEPGLLRVVVYGAFPIDEDGVLLNLRFIAVGSVGSVSPISFERIVFNEGEPRVSVTDGKVQLF